MTEKKKYKPYLKISYKQGVEIVNCKDIIKDTFNQNNIGNAKEFYMYIIKPIYITNTENAECILKEIIIDRKPYKVAETLLLKNESINFLTTYTAYINSKEPLKSILLSANDILGTKYYYKCDFKCNIKDPPGITTYPTGEKLNVWTVDYEITNISLPNENSNF